MTTDLEKYLGKLKELRLRHAWESVTRPTEVTANNFSYIVGFQSGLDKAEKLLEEVLKGTEK